MRYLMFLLAILSGFLQGVVIGYAIGSLGLRLAGKGGYKW
jgi:hypothetical protein